jgi:hypothetical protein
MPSLALFTKSSFIKPVGAALLALVMAGCAQQKPAGYYDTPHDSTESDALNQAQGRTSARAPSQIQLDFGNTQETRKPQATQDQATETATIKARALTEAKTFLGTVPCLVPNSSCSATRVTLTLAPGGEWRSRTVMLDNTDAKNNTAEQGCWSVIGTKPLRILLQLKNETVKANLTFVNDNVLRVNTFNEIQPALDYHLTRQQDLDPIDELASQPALQCG